MPVLKWTKGHYRVTRLCCISGLCVKCHKRGNHGDPKKRSRIIHTDYVSRKWADHVASGWTLYDPIVERMPLRAKVKS